MTLTLVSPGSQTFQTGGLAPSAWGAAGSLLRVTIPDTPLHSSTRGPVAKRHPQFTPMNTEREGEMNWKGKGESHGCLGVFRACWQILRHFSHPEVEFNSRPHEYGRTSVTDIYMWRKLPWWLANLGQKSDTASVWLVCLSFLSPALSFSSRLFTLWTEPSCPMETKQLMREPCEEEPGSSIQPSSNPLTLSSWLTAALALWVHHLGRGSSSLQLTCPSCCHVGQGRAVPPSPAQTREAWGKQRLVVLSPWVSGWFVIEK